MRTWWEKVSVRVEKMFIRLTFSHHEFGSEKDEGVWERDELLRGGK